MSKAIKFKNDTYLDSTSIVHNQELLSDILDETDAELVELNNKLHISEKGFTWINKSNFTSYSFGTSTFYYKHINFTKTYSNLPTVLFSIIDNTSKTYWGSLASQYIKELTTSGFDIIDPNVACKYVGNSQNAVGFNYIVISND